MRIIVDADATPAIRLIEEVAKNYKIECILIADDSHELQSEYSSIIIVSKGHNSADIYILNNIKQNDIVITQDYGIACVALSKKCFVVNTYGYEYTELNIDSLLMNRYLNLKSKKKIGPKKRNIEDNKRLINTLDSLIALNLK